MGTYLKRKVALNQAIDYDAVVNWDISREHNTRRDPKK